MICKPNGYLGVGGEGERFIVEGIQIQMSINRKNTEHVT